MQSSHRDCIELKGHSDSVDQLCWDPTHSEYLATASADKTVRIWDSRGIYQGKLYIYF